MKFNFKAGLAVIVEKIDLYKYFKIKKPENASGILTTYILANCYEPRLRPAMLVIPGGGYSHVSARECECVALKYMEKGFNAFTLSYSVKGKCDVCFPYQLIEGAMAMAYIKKNAKKLGVGIGIKGLYNIQFIVDKDEKVFIIEVNPRSSRTVPFLSKATGYSLADIPRNHIRA